MDVRDLAFMAEKQPAAGEDTLQLLLIDLVRAEHAAVEEALFGRRNGACRARHGGFLPGL